MEAPHGDEGFSLEGVAQAMLFGEARTAAAVQEDPTMRITRAERERALAIKAAVEADDRVVGLTDFQYVQYALTSSEETVEYVCQKVYMMQCFKEEYKITDEISQGIELFYQMALVQHLGAFLAVEYVPSCQNYILIADYAAFYPSKIQTYHQKQVFYGGIFYLYHCQNQDFRSMRNGISFLVECMGVSFANNFDPNFMENWMVELFHHYPKNIKESYYLNSNAVVNMTYAVWKRFLPERVQKAFRLGLQIAGLEGQRIDALYNTPTAEQARERMLLKVLRFLNRRYQNQKAFSLETAASEDREVL